MLVKLEDQLIDWLIKTNVHNLNGKLTHKTKEKVKTKWFGGFWCDIDKEDLTNNLKLTKNDSNYLVSGNSFNINSIINIMHKSWLFINHYTTKKQNLKFSFYFFRTQEDVIILLGITIIPQTIETTAT